jgi:CheY-like chemotaxis protein
MVIRYRVWREGNLWYWESCTESGFKIGSGANSDAAKARAEALSHSAPYARVAEIDTIERSTSAEILDRVCAMLSDVQRRQQIAQEHRTEFLGAWNTVKLLVARSHDCARSARELLECDKVTASPFVTACDQPDPGSLGLSGLRVLVVEDSRQVATALKRLLEIGGAEVAGPVATASDAVRLISERAPDAALVDISLRSGELSYDLIDQLHDQGIHVIVITGYRHVSFKQGKVAAVLQKPVSGEVILTNLRRLCAL